MVETEEPVQVHGLLVYFAKVDNPDSKYGGVNKSFNEMKEAWLNWLRESEAVKSKADQIKKIEIGSLAYFYLKDSKLQFHCTKYDRPTSLARCEDGCVKWDREDNCCTAEAMGHDIDEVEKSKDMLLDTMHVLRMYPK